MSGTIGKRRAKRSIHLFERAQSSNDAQEFLVHVISNLGSAETLKKFLNKNNNNAFTLKAIAVSLKITQQQLDQNPVFLLAVEIFKDFLNVVNYPSYLFRNQFNKIISQFSFSDLLNPNSELSKEIIRLKSAMDRQLRIEQHATRLFNR